MASAKHADLPGLMIFLIPSENEEAVRDLRRTAFPSQCRPIAGSLKRRSCIVTKPASVSFDGRGFTLRKAMSLKEHYFGMGDKTGVLDRRGYTFTNWNSDTFGYTPSTDPIYKSIPFFVGMGASGGS